MAPLPLEAHFVANGNKAFTIAAECSLLQLE